MKSTRVHEQASVSAKQHAHASNVTASLPRLKMRLVRSSCISPSIPYIICLQSISSTLLLLVLQATSPVSQSLFTSQTLQSFTFVSITSVALFSTSKQKQVRYLVSQPSSSPTYTIQSASANLSCSFSNINRYNAFLHQDHGHPGPPHHLRHPLLCPGFRQRCHHQVLGLLQ